MSVITASFSDFFAGASVILTNAQTQPEIAAALDAFGYDADALQQGQVLFNTARTLYDSQIKEYGEQHAATQAFKEAVNQADKSYAAHRQLAKVAFKTDAQRQTDLRLNERKPLAFNAWHEQARHFYTALLADSDAQSQLARYRVTSETLQAAQAQVAQTFALNSTQEQEKGEAQNATKQRDAAIEALCDWLSDFKVVAKIALEDSPQLLEALNLGAIA
ncbi:MAG: hypothetical protein FOGNACKC_06298 [Anaerolineae bacterium]|nr:hypothetical protein [Anaerolineae bacterium]